MRMGAEVVAGLQDLPELLLKREAQDAVDAIASLSKMKLGVHFSLLGSWRGWDRTKVLSG